MKMKKIVFYFLSLAILVASCKKNDNDGEGSQAGVVNLKSGDVITGNYSGNVTLEEGTYTLKGYVYIENGGSITIPAGTVIKSDITRKGALIIERGAKIMAEGTASKPIVFTSGNAVGSRNPGDWGGIIILGKAKTNRSSEPLIEGGVNSYYGGNDDADNSGVMKYVRIEFAGIAAAPGSEINGLTLGAVGSGTTLEYIQVAYGNDDAFEFFGGTVNAKYLISYATADDDFDFDFGYTGKLQFGVALRNPLWVDGGDAGNGIECDNDGSGTTATPLTRPVISNFTFVGPNDAANTAANHNFANRFRRNSRFVLNNSVLIGWQKGGLSLESNGTYNDFVSGTASSEFKNNIVHAVSDPFKLGSDVTTTGASATAIQTKATAAGSSSFTSATAAMLTTPFSLTAPNFLPATGSPALAGAAFSGDLSNPFFTQVAYKGAFGMTNWMSGWTNFNFTKGANGY
jgi:hypothetical protein